MVLHLKRGDKLDQRALLRRLAEMQYTRNDIDFTQGCYRVRGDVIDIFPAESDRDAIRVELFDDVIDSLARFDPLTGEVRAKIPRYTVYPGTHYVTPKDRLVTSIDQIREDLRARLQELYADQQAGGSAAPAAAHHLRPGDDPGDRLLPGHRELLALSLRPRSPASRRPCLYDYLPPEALLIVDESHQTIPQLGAMYKGDRSRKETLVEYGFRLPSALDNRPLKFEEWEAIAPQMIFVSATPGKYEARKAGQVVEQLVRPTGLVDPVVEIRPVRTQVDDVLSEINNCAERGERVLVTTLTKRMAEDLTEYLDEHGVKVRYLHSDVETVERTEIIRDLRLGKFDAIVGINLLREGLDMPEVALVAILDADKEGFLRSEGSLIQTIGRAARNLNGRAILYADRETGSMQRALAETAPPPRQAAGLQRRARHHAAWRDPARSRTSWKARASPRSSAQKGGKWQPAAASDRALGPGRDTRADRRARSSAWKARCCAMPATWSSRKPAACRDAIQALQLRRLELA